MRILRIAQKVYPEVKGGGPYHVHAMSRDQAAMGHEVTVLTLDPDGDKPHTEEHDGYTIIRYPVTVSALGNDISTGLASYLRSAKEFDIMHAHSHLYFSTNLAALKRRTDGLPLAITNHGLYSQNISEFVFGLYLRTVGRATLEQANIVFCYTDEEAKKIKDLSGCTKTQVIHNGIDTKRFSPDGPFASKLIGKPSILFVGRLVEGKRPADAIRAVQMVKNELPNVGLTICGQGECLSELKGLVSRYNLEKNVEFKGQVPYREMPHFYRGADILILPSRTEGLPRTVLESMASGTPVICSNLKQVSSIVEGSGQTVEIGDIDGYCRAIKQISFSKSAMANPRKRIIEEYNWNDTVKQTTEALQSITNE